MIPFAVQNSAALLQLELQVSIHLTCSVKAFRAHASMAPSAPSLAEWHLARSRSPHRVVYHDDHGSPALVTLSPFPAVVPMLAGFITLSTLTSQKRPCSIASWHQNVLIYSVTRPGPRLVVMRRAAFESVCRVHLRFTAGEGDDAKRCRTCFEDRNPHPDHDTRTALAFRLLRRPIAVSEKRQGTVTASQQETCVPHAVGVREYVRARARATCVASATSRMTFLSVRYQIAQHTDEAAQPGILRFISKCICITPFGTLHRRSRHTICPSAVQFTHLDCLRALCWISRPQKQRLSPFRRIVRLVPLPGPMIANRLVSW